MPDPSVTLAAMSVRPWPTGSTSLASTVTKIGSPCVVRATSGTAVGGGRFGSVTVTVTLADAAAPALSVTV